MYALGAVLGGLVSGFAVAVIAGISGGLPQLVAFGVVMIVGVVLVSAEFGWLPLAIPSVDRQVPQGVFRRRLLGYMQFGFEMGTGFRTHSTASAPFLLAILLLGTNASVVLPLLAGMMFGLARGLVPFSRLFSRDRQLWITRLERASSPDLYARVVGPAALVAAFSLLGANPGL